VFSITLIAEGGEAPRLDSTAGTGWSGLSGEVEEKGGGDQKTEGGPEIIDTFS